MASAVPPVTGRAGRIDRSSRPLERTTAISTMCKASMRAQKFLFGAVVTAAQQTGDCAHNGGAARAPSGPTPYTTWDKKTKPRDSGRRQNHPSAQWESDACVLRGGAGSAHTAT